MNKRTRLSAMIGAASTVGIAAALFAGAAPAFAGNPLDCQNGKTCVYTANNYDGSKYSLNNVVTTYASGYNNQVSSIVNRTASPITYFDGGNHSGDSRKVAAGDVRRDLANNQFNDKASSHHFSS